MLINNISNKLYNNKFVKFTDKKIPSRVQKATKIGLATLGAASLCAQGYFAWKNYTPQWNTVYGPSNFIGPRNNPPPKQFPLAIQFHPPIEIDPHFYTNVALLAAITIFPIIIAALTTGRSSSNKSATLAEKIGLQSKKSDPAGKEEIKVNPKEEEKALADAPPPADDHNNGVTEDSVDDEEDFVVVETPTKTEITDNHLHPPTGGWLLLQGARNMGAFAISTVGGLAVAGAKAVINATILKNPDWVEKKCKHALAPILGLFKTKNKSKKPSELKQEIGNLKEILEDTSLTFTDQHAQFLGKLREIINRDDFKKEIKKKQQGQDYTHSIDDILGICRTIFTDVHLYTFCEDLLRKIGLKSNILQNEDFETIDNAANDFKLPKIETAINRLGGHFNFRFDPHLQGNIPFALGEIELEGKPVRLLRMGTPTIQADPRESAQINPEFCTYLQSLAFEDKKHLYVSLQNDIPKIHGDETGRNAAIKALQTDFPNFRSVVLAQDSHFYKQSDLFENVNLWSGFKKHFDNQMFGTKNHGFYFPDELRNEGTFRNESMALLDQMKDVLFPEKTSLTKEERLDLIELYYAVFVLYLAKKTNVDFVNVSCKDAIDRAGKTNSLILKMVMIAQELEDDKSLKKHQILTHAAAFLVKSQAIIPGRRERLINAYNRICDADVSQRFKDAMKTGILSQIGLNLDNKLKIREDDDQKTYSYI